MTKDLIDKAKEILLNATNLTSNSCICGHSVQAHQKKEGYRLCVIEDCDCLEFEGV